MEKIPVLVVDDEPPAQRELCYLINQVQGFEIVGVAGSGAEALELFQRVRPRAVFLDIQIYDINGINLAKRMREMDNGVIIIFATAHDRFAVQAYDLAAVDYIVKPYSTDRVARTLHRVATAVRLREEDQKFNRLVEMLKAENAGPARICTESEGKWSVIDSRDIVYVAAANRKTVIKLTCQKLCSSYTLQELEEKLDKNRFLRVHRAFLVNLEYVREVIPWFKGTYKLVLGDGQKSEVPVSRSHARLLKEKLGLVKAGPS
ncbi:MAG: LytTR family DNA-binding domain-containing protein [Peptococcaceae bacterium]|nr:LytTR family DNA-binding domain-containing protein [Peptococcaceae bacterium]